MRLPAVDTHEIEVAAPPLTVWRALADTIRETLSRPSADVVARLTGVGEPGVDGPQFPQTGSQVQGFRVAESVPGRRLRLEGEHRFSQYALDFELLSVAGRTRLSATTTRPSRVRSGRSTGRSCSGPAHIYSWSGTYCGRCGGAPSGDPDQASRTAGERGSP